MSEIDKKMSSKVPKMTLKGYYEGLPEAKFPKTEFVNKIVHETGVSTATVHNWIHGKTKPSEKKYVEKLCEITGLLEEELWN